MLERPHLQIFCSIYTVNDHQIINYLFFHLRISTRFAAFNTNDDSREKSSGRIRVRAQYKRTLRPSECQTTGSIM
jgi:hypothetical protein